MKQFNSFNLVGHVHPDYATLPLIKILIASSMDRLVKLEQASEILMVD